MPTVDYWLGDAGDDYAEVCVRSDTAGTVTITGGVAEPVDVDPLVGYGIAKLRVTGLSVDTRYPIVLYLDGVEVASATVRTMPAAGTSWTFGFGSCVGQNQLHAYGYQYVLDHDIRLFFALGDTPYCDESVASLTVDGTAQRRWQLGSALPGSYLGYTSGRVAWDETYHYLQVTPGWEYLTQHVPMLRMGDDHEIGNDWDWSLSWVSGFSPTVTTQAEVDQIGYDAGLAFMSWSIGNPTNTDSGAQAWKPSSCADSASNHPPLYFRKTVDNVEFLILDCTGHMDPQSTKVDTLGKVCVNRDENAVLGYSYSDPAGAALAKTRLGPYQLNWLLDRLLASTATFKVILSPKVPYRSNAISDNNGWSNFVTEREYIMAFIRRYVTGVLWLTGDMHEATVFNQIAGHACVNSSCLGQRQYLTDSGARFYRPGMADGVIFRLEGHDCPVDPGVKHNTDGVVRVTPDYLEPMLYSENGTLLWSGYLPKGKNVMVPSLGYRAGEWA